jgi:hypothetical protein
VDIRAQLLILVNQGMTWEQIKLMGIEEVIIFAMSSDLAEQEEVIEDGPNEPIDFEKERETFIMLDESDDEDFTEDATSKSFISSMNEKTTEQKLHEKIAMIQSVEFELADITKRKTVTMTKVSKLKGMVDSMQNDLTVVNAKLTEFLEKKKLIQTHLEPILKELIEDNKWLFRQEQQVAAVIEKKNAYLEELDVLKSISEKEEEQRAESKSRRLEETPSSKSVVEFFGCFGDGSWFVPSDLFLPQIEEPTSEMEPEIFEAEYNFKQKDIITIIPKICGITRKQTNQFTQENYEIMLSYRPDHVDAWLGFASFFLNEKEVPPTQRAESALDVLDRALKHNPTSVILWSVKLEMAIRTYVTSPDKIRMTFANALQNHPLNPHFYWSYLSWEMDNSLKFEFLLQIIANFVTDSNEIEKSQRSLMLFNCFVHIILICPETASRVFLSLYNKTSFTLDGNLNQFPEEHFIAGLGLMEDQHRCTFALIFVLFRNYETIPTYLFYDAPHQNLCIPKPFLISRFKCRLDKKLWEESVKILESEANFFQKRDLRWMIVLKMNVFNINVTYGLWSWDAVLLQVNPLLQSYPFSNEFHRWKAVAIAKTKGLDSALDYIRHTKRDWELVIVGVKLIGQLERDYSTKVKTWIFENELSLANALAEYSVTDSYTFYDFLTNNVIFKKETVFLIWYRFCLVSILEKEPRILLEKKNLNEIFSFVLEYPQKRIIHEM